MIKNETESKSVVGVCFVTDVCNTVFMILKD